MPKTTFVLLFFIFLSPHSCAKRRRGGGDSSSGGGDATTATINVTAVSGAQVDLACRVRPAECGELYGLEWYRISKEQQKRVYFYHHPSGRGKAEGGWRGRAGHAYDAGAGVMRVTLAPALASQDGGVYRCEVTYAKKKNSRWMKDSCLGSQSFLLTMLERPRFLTVMLENGTEVEDGQVLGPLDEESLLVLRCSAGGGKPAPKVRDV